MTSDRVGGTRNDDRRAGHAGVSPQFGSVAGRVKDRQRAAQQTARAAAWGRRTGLMPPISQEIFTAHRLAPGCDPLREIGPRHDRDQLGCAGQLTDQRLAPSVETGDGRQ